MITVRQREKAKSLVLGLLRQTVFQEPQEAYSSHEHFIAGNTFPFFSVVVEWWQTLKCKKYKKALALTLIEFNELPALALEDSIKVIDTSLHELAANAKLFYLGKILSKGPHSLLECASCDIPELFDEIWNYFCAQANKHVRFRLLIAPIMPRLTGDTLILEDEGVGVIRRDDQMKWSEIAVPRFDYGAWSISAGAFQDGRTFFAEDKFDLYGISIDKGSHKITAETSYFKLRLLLSIIVASNFVLNNFYFHTVLADPPRHYIQFDDAQSYIASGDTPLLPFYADDITIDNKISQSVRDWYFQLRKLDREKSERAHTSAHYVNLALNSKGNASFLFSYIALDALFGIRHAVESSIETGVNRIHPASYKKMKWLFNLRNELVHGGSRRIEDWSDYGRYVDHFDSEPQNDLRDTVLHCLLDFTQQSI